MKTNPGLRGPAAYSRLAGAAAMSIAASVMLAATLSAQQSPYASNSDFAQHARMLRENALLKVEPQQMQMPQVYVPTSSPRFFSRSPWKENIVTTIFWTGERPTKNNPTPNHASSWDSNWAVNYGGYDDPEPTARRNFLPVAFIPRQNPFYCALPYNDVTRGSTKPEARLVIPWFKQAYVAEGKTVCKDRWLAIRHGNRMAYAQWEDCGPFRTDHWQYVFGTDRPLPNLNDGAGLDVSPAVRDWLGMNGSRDACDWRFVEANEVPPGPWRLYGDNNSFVINKSRTEQRVQIQGGRSLGGAPSLFGQ